MFAVEDVVRLLVQNRFSFRRSSSLLPAEALEALAKTIRGARVGIADERQALEAQLAATRQLLDAALQKKTDETMDVDKEMAAMGGAISRASSSPQAFSQ